MFSLLRSKQSEDVGALSIISNKNASALETQINELITLTGTLQTDVNELKANVLSQTDLLNVDLSILTDPQNSGNFSFIVSSVIETTKTTFQLFVTFLNTNISYDFEKKLFMLIHKENVLKPVFIKINSTSVIFNFELLNADLDNNALKLIIHA